MDGLDELILLILILMIYVQCLRAYDHDYMLSSWIVLYMYNCVSTRKLLDVRMDMAVESWEV